MTSPITTHILDVAAGVPAEGVDVVLQRLAGDGWETLGASRTDADGRVADLLAGGPFEAGDYRLRFAVGEYQQKRGGDAFYPEAVIVFTVADPSQHYHVPLLLSPFGFTTYRGS